MQRLLTNSIIRNYKDQIKNDKPKKPRAKRRPEKVKKIAKEKEVEDKEVDGDEEIARVLSTVKSKTKECFFIYYYIHFIANNSSFFWYN